MKRYPFSPAPAFYRWETEAQRGESDLAKSGVQPGLDVTLDSTERNHLIIIPSLHLNPQPGHLSDRQGGMCLQRWQKGRGTEGETKQGVMQSCHLGHLVGHTYILGEPRSVSMWLRNPGMDEHSHRTCTHTNKVIERKPQGTSTHYFWKTLIFILCQPLTAAPFPKPSANGFADTEDSARKEQLRETIPHYRKYQLAGQTLCFLDGKWCAVQLSRAGARSDPQQDLLLTLRLSLCLPPTCLPIPYPATCGRQCLVHHISALMDVSGSVQVHIFPLLR